MVSGMQKELMDLILKILVKKGKDLIILFVILMK